MFKFFDNNRIKIYLGNSFDVNLILEDETCRTCHLTPYSKKNLKNAYNLDYDKYTEKWISIFSKILSDDGTFLVGCNEEEQTYLIKHLENIGFFLISDYVFNTEKLYSLSEYLGRKYLHQIDHYLLFSKKELDIKVDIDSAMYPKELIRRIMKETTDINDLVFHPFLNTGKPVVIANELARRCVTISSDLYWCKVAKERIIDKQEDFLWSYGLV